jgi:hypothetical protein
MAKKPLQDSYDSRRQHQREPKGGRADGYWGGMPHPSPKKPTPAPVDERKPDEQK